MTLSKLMTSPLNFFCNQLIPVMRYAIWYHLYILKNVKNTHGEVLVLVKLQAEVLKLAILHGCFSRFLKCTNSTKLHKASMLNCKCANFHRNWSNSLKISSVVNSISLPYLPKISALSRVNVSGRRDVQ